MNEFIAKTFEGKSVKLTMTDHGNVGNCYLSSFVLPDGKRIWSEYRPTRFGHYLGDRIKTDYEALRVAGIDPSTIEDIV
jgi:hypothetical protein